MKRTPIVVTATAAGLVGVLAFHTSPSSVTISPLSGTAGSPPGPAASGQAGSQGTSGGSAASGSASGSAQSATRTADGPAVNYSFGILSVSVTVRDHKILKVGIASLNDGGAYRSQLIDQQSIPLLEQQALQTQSANIQGVSGASYTSAGFRTSLQAALRSLGLS